MKQRGYIHFHQNKDEWGEGIGDIQGPLVSSQRGAEDLKRDLYPCSRYDLERFALRWCCNSQSRGFTSEGNHFAHSASVV